MPKLVMTFDGLCAFVSSLDRKQMRVILVNAAGSRHQHSHSGGRAIPSHYPFIRFPRARRIPVNGRRIPQVVLQGVSELRFFDWDDMKIVRGGEYPSSLKIAEGRKPGTAEPGKAAEVPDFSWVSELEKINPKCSSIKPECLRADPPRNLVLGRITLTEGTIGVFSVFEEFAGVKTIWELGDGLKPGSYSQALAAIVRYELEFPEAYITLRFTRFGPGQSFDLRLKPNRNGIIPVEVGNLPLEEALKMDVLPASQFDSLTHFEMLYRLAQEPPEIPLSPRPVGHARMLAGGDTRGGTTMCLGLTFAAADPS
jgi:hypothetical protein